MALTLQNSPKDKVSREAELGVGGGGNCQPESAGLPGKGCKFEPGVAVLVEGQDQAAHAEQGLPDLHILLRPP